MWHYAIAEKAMEAGYALAPAEAFLAFVDEPLACELTSTADVSTQVSRDIPMSVRSRASF